MLIVGTLREIHVIPRIDGSSSLLHRVFQARNLVDGTVIADYHSIETHIVAKDVLQDPTVCHTVHRFFSWNGNGSISHGVIARHHHLTASQTDHGLMREKDFLHQDLLISIAASTITQVVLGASTHTLRQVTLLKPSYKSHTHHSGEIAILTIRFLQTIEARCAANIHHR